MIDFVLGIILAGLIIRGWLRGLVREAIGLAVIVAGIFLAFRLAGPVGSVVSAMSGAGDSTARFAGGIIVFLLVSVGGGVVSWIAHKGVRAVPGLTTVNRAAGAAFSGLAGVLIATVVVSALSLAPLPATAKESLDNSSLVAGMIDPDGLPQALVGLVSFDRVLTAALELDGVIGSHKLVAPQRGRIELEPATPDEVREAGKATDRLGSLVNRARVAAGADPIDRTDLLDQVARSHAEALYQAGYLSHNTGSGRIPARLDAAGHRYVTAGEEIALAPTVSTIIEVLTEDADAAATLGDKAYRRMGVAVVRGPLGLLGVVVLAG